MITGTGRSCGLENEAAVRQQATRCVVCGTILNPQHRSNFVRCRRCGSPICRRCLDDHDRDCWTNPQRQPLSAGELDDVYSLHGRVVRNREVLEVLVAGLMCETWRRLEGCRMGMRMTTWTDVAVSRQLQNIRGHLPGDPDDHQHLLQHGLSGRMISQRCWKAMKGMTKLTARRMG